MRNETAQPTGTTGTDRHRSAQRWVVGLLAALLLLPAAALGQTNTKQAQVQPMPPVATACCTLTAGGVAQNFQNATTNANTGAQSPVACVIVNPATATEQAVAVEAIWVDVVATAAAAAGSTSVPIEAGWSLIVYPSTRPISWIAATTGHKITGWCWQ